MAGLICMSGGPCRAASSLTASPCVTQTSPVRGSVAVQTPPEPSGTDSTSTFIVVSITSTVPAPTVICDSKRSSAYGYAVDDGPRSTVEDHDLVRVRDYDVNVAVALVVGDSER